MKNKLKELREKFQRAEIDKATFISQMYGLHSLLFDYANYISETEISAIEIKESEVVMSTRNGIKLACPQDDERTPPIEALNFLRYEPEAEELIYKLIEPGDHVFDIGANIGWYSLNFAKSHPGVKVYCFEPIEKTFKALKRNIALNGLSNVEAFNFGFWKSEETLEFHFYPRISAAASIADILQQDGMVTVSCPVKKMDDFVQEKKLRIDFIKCDVEGAEMFVYEGGLESIKKYQPIIFSEMLRKWAAKFNYHPNEIIALLAGAGYKCFVLQGEKLIPFGKMDDNTKDTNFYFLHQKKHARQIGRLTGDPNARS